MGEEENHHRSGPKDPCIIHHFLVNGEEYLEEGSAKLTKLRFRALARIPLEAMTEALKYAGYAVRALG